MSALVLIGYGALWIAVGGIVLGLLIFLQIWTDDDR